MPTRYEPGLPYLLNFAYAKDLIRIGDHDLFGLTDLGAAAAQRIEDSGTFESELSFLREFGARLNESATSRIMSGGLYPEVTP
jgi:hypothetical protein